MITKEKHFNLTEAEHMERNRLLKLQQINTRWFTKEEYERLKYLSDKMFKNAGSPTNL